MGANYNHGNNGRKNGRPTDGRDEIWTKVIRAGKRTYFFDIKATKANDFYLTITESKKNVNSDGNHYYEKHKIFLYKEDFDKFTNALDLVLNKIGELRGEGFALELPEEGNLNLGTEQLNLDAEDIAKPNSFTDVNFDDLGAPDID